MQRRIFTLTITIALLISFSCIQVFSEQDPFQQVFEDQSSVPVIATQGKPKGLSTLESQSVILLDSATGQVLFEKESHKRLAPASVTKIMSMLLIMEAINNGKIKKSDMVACSEYASSMGGSQVFLSPNEQMTVNDLLKCVAVASANDATMALAEYISGSEEAFVGEMNKKAAELGMKDTLFMNPTGLDADNHYTTAYDIGIMSRELLNKYPDITKYTSIWMDSIRGGEFGLNNTNNLIRFYKGCDGLKTGSTSKALFCVSETAVRDGLRLICVIMSAPSSKVRFAEASMLLDHGFSNYKSVSIAKKGDVYGTIDVAKGIQAKVECVIDKDIKIIVRKGEEGDVEKLVELPQKVTAPIQLGQNIGKLIIKTDSKEVGQYNLVAKEAINKTNIWNLFDSMIKRSVFLK